MKGKYIICIQEETELEEWRYGFLVHQGNRIYADGNPPGLFTDVVVPEGKTPIDNDGCILGVKIRNILLLITHFSGRE